MEESAIHERSPETVDPMVEALMAIADRLFPNKEIMTKEELAQVLECDPKVIYYWIKRSDPTKRPPRLILGSEIKFSKREFMRWVVKEQGRSGEARQR